MKRRRGFTFVELLTAMIFFGLLTALATAKYADLKNQALTSAIAADFRVIHLAVFNYWADNASWPSEVGAGVMPAGLAPYLPSGFQWVKPFYTLDYDEFPVGGNYLVGVNVTTPDANLMAKLMQNLGGKNPFFVQAGGLTYIIVGPGGIS